MNAEEQAFLEASLAQRASRLRAEEARRARERGLEARSRRVLRALAAVLLAATVGALALTAVALRERRVARQSAAEAQNLALASGATAALSRGNTDQALALALEASRMEHALPQAELALSQAAYTPGTRRLMVGPTADQTSVTVSPDGRSALSTWLDKPLILWDIATGQMIRRLEGHSAEVNDVAYSPDGRMALSSSQDKTLILWDVGNGREIRRFVGHEDVVRNLAWSPDGRMALSGGGSLFQSAGTVDRTLILWDVATGQVIRRFEGHNDVVEDIAFSPDGGSALSASGDDTLIL